MNNIFRGLLAGYGAKKLGGGCFSTVLVFVLLWVLLGQCNAALPPQVHVLDAAKIDVVKIDRVRQDYSTATTPLTISPMALGMAER